MRTPRIVHTIALIAPLFVVSSARGETEKEQGNSELAEAAKRLNEQCGTKIAVAYDWQSEKASPGKPEYQGPVYCKSIVEGVTTGCSDAIGKSVIAANVKTIMCRLEEGASKKAPSGPVLAFAGTKLDASYDWRSSNLDADTYKWVMKTWTVAAENGPVTIEARNERKTGEAELPAAIENFQTRCGAKIPVAYEWSSEKGNDAKPAWQGYFGCRDVLKGLGDGCEHDAAKDAFAKKITSVTCRFEKGASKRKDLDPEYGGAAHSLKGKALTVSYDWNSSNLDSASRRWAQKLK